MKNVLRVLKRDILRLLKVPPAIVVVLALLVLPSAYTWYNVLGFWNPYENTGHLSVCVVNEDRGADSELTGHIDVGQMIVDELHDNHQLDWRFVSYDEAMAQVQSGESYAAYVIPEDFSEKLLTITSGDFQKPDVDYYVNEKEGPVAPKITDTGANTLDDRINTAFVETVAEKATEALDHAIDQSNAQVTQAKSHATRQVQEAKASLEQASASIAELANRAQDAKARAEAAKASLQTAKGAIDDASDAMSSVAAVSSSLQSNYMSFAATSVPLITSAMQDAADAYAEAARAIASLPAQDEQTRALLERLRSSADAAQAAASRYSHILADEVSPALGEQLGDLASAASKAAGSIAAQKIIISQAEVVLNDMVATLDSATTALAQTHDLVESLAQDIDRIETDTMMIAGSTLVSDLIGEGSLNAKTVAEFISSPTELKTEQLYPVDTYGAAMAPLFMNLTFWIGAFMLMVVMREDVDTTGIKNLTLTQRYVGRYLLFAIMAALQAVICVAGLPFIGMHIVNLPALFFAAIVASLTYLSVIYALSVTMQHIGKGICVVLVFAQIPAATGLYPIEMTSAFFQAVYHWLPFTYGISAMREAICGFYGFQYLQDLLMLFLFFAVFMAAGIIVRPWLSNVNRMFARQLKMSGIFNGDDVEVPARRFRMSQVLRALTEAKEYRMIVLRRYETFQRVYPKLIRGAIIFGIAVPVVVGVLGSLGLTGKVVLLTVWICWFIFLFLFLIIVESLRSSFARQMHLDKMDESELRSLYLTRNATEQADTSHVVRKGSGVRVENPRQSSDDSKSQPGPYDASAPKKESDDQEGDADE